ARWNARPASGRGRGLPLAALCLMMLWLGTYGSAAAAGDREGSSYGAHGPEGPRMREQFWVVPGADAQVPLRATVFRPAEVAGNHERLPLVMINHGSDAFTREAVAMPVFYWLSRCSWTAAMSSCCRSAEATAPRAESLPRAATPAPIPTMWAPA